MTDRSEQVVLRKGLASDLPFIYRSILMGTFFGNRPNKGAKPDLKAPTDFFGAINQDVFMSKYHKHLESLFSRPSVSIVIACLQSNDDVILGFSVTENNTLHFVFVKPDWRRIGLAKDLVPGHVDTVSGFTRVGDIIRKKRNWSFDPWS